MGEKGNGGHVATGGARAVRTAGTGLGGSEIGGSQGSGGGGGGGLLGGIAGEVQDHVTDVGLGAVEQVQEHRHDD